MEGDTPTTFPHVCRLCNITCESSATWAQHRTSKKHIHRKQLADAKKKESGSPAPPAPLSVTAAAAAAEKTAAADKTSGSGTAAASALPVPLSKGQRKKLVEKQRRDEQRERDRALDKEMKDRQRLGQLAAGTKERAVLEAEEKEMKEQLFKASVAVVRAESDAGDAEPIVVAKADIPAHASTNLGDLKIGAASVSSISTTSAPAPPAQPAPVQSAPPAAAPPSYAATTKMGFSPQAAPMKSPGLTPSSRPTPPSYQATVAANGAAPHIPPAGLALPPAAAAAAAADAGGGGASVLTAHIRASLKLGGNDPVPTADASTPSDSSLQQNDMHTRDVGGGYYRTVQGESTSPAAAAATATTNPSPVATASAPVAPTPPAPETHAQPTGAAVGATPLTSPAIARAAALAAAAGVQRPAPSQESPPPAQQPQQRQGQPVPAQTSYYVDGSGAQAQSATFRGDASTTSQQAQAQAQHQAQAQAQQAHEAQRAQQEAQARAQQQRTDEDAGLRQAVQNAEDQAAAAKQKAAEAASEEEAAIEELTKHVQKMQQVNHQYTDLLPVQKEQERQQVLVKYQQQGLMVQHAPDAQMRLQYLAQLQNGELTQIEQRYGGALHSIQLQYAEFVKQHSVMALRHQTAKQNVLRARQEAAKREETAGAAREQLRARESSCVMTAVQQSANTQHHLQQQQQQAQAQAAAFGASMHSMASSASATNAPNMNIIIGEEAHKQRHMQQLNTAKSTVVQAVAVAEPVNGSPATAVIVDPAVQRKIDMLAGRPTAAITEDASPAPTPAPAHPVEPPQTTGPEALAHFQQKTDGAAGILGRTGADDTPTLPKVTGGRAVSALEALRAAQKNSEAAKEATASGSKKEAEKSAKESVEVQAAKPHPVWHSGVTRATYEAAPCETVGQGYTRPVILRCAHPATSYDPTLSGLPTIEAAAAAAHAGRPVYFGSTAVDSHTGGTDSDADSPAVAVAEAGTVRGAHPSGHRGVNVAAPSAGHPDWDTTAAHAFFAANVALTDEIDHVLELLTAAEAESGAAASREATGSMTAMIAQCREEPRGFTAEAKEARRERDVDARARAGLLELLSLSSVDVARLHGGCFSDAAVTPSSLTVTDALHFVPLWTACRYNLGSNPALCRKAEAESSATRGHFEPSLVFATDREIDVAIAAQKNAAAATTAGQKKDAYPPLYAAPGEFVPERGFAVECPDWRFSFTKAQQQRGATCPRNEGFGETIELSPEARELLAALPAFESYLNLDLMGPQRTLRIYDGAETPSADESTTTRSESPAGAPTGSVPVTALTPLQRLGAHHQQQRWKAAMAARAHPMTEEYPVAAKPTTADVCRHATQSAVVAASYDSTGAPLGAKGSAGLEAALATRAEAADPLGAPIPAPDAVLEAYATSATVSITIWLRTAAYKAMRCDDAQASQWRAVRSGAAVEVEVWGATDRTSVIASGPKETVLSIQRFLRTVAATA